MIDPGVRNAIYQLHVAGRPLREISRQLKVSRNRVRAVIRQQGTMSRKVRKDKIQIDPDLLRGLYHECDGWIERVQEKLGEEQGIRVSYPTLTRIIRELDLGNRAPERCQHVPDEPGAEMQHDTTVYQLKLSGQTTRLVASLLYLRYSKRRYLKLYRVFDRFVMKCFLHEALMFWGYAARQCIIDNTNLARLRGSGKQAVIVPEMATFAERYGFQFVCHELQHCNRKAGEERSFWTVETNFLPGRRFDSLEDLNRQAFQWATVRMHHRPASKTGLIYYWVPGTKREDVKLLRYADHLEIYQHGNCVAKYALPPDGVKNGRFGPEGQALPRHMPKNRHRGSEQEEKRLRAIGSDVSAYVDYVSKTPGIQRHRFLRELVALSQKMTQAVFVKAVARALRYRIVQLQTIERIAWFCMSQDQAEQCLPHADVDENFRQRPAYQEGCLTDEPDLSIYEQPERDGDDDPSNSTQSEQHDG